VAFTPPNERIEAMATMHFDKQGSGPAVVLIHGLGAYSFSWRDTVAALSGHFTTYAVDLLGFGGSATPPKSYTAEAQADAVRDFIKAQGLSNPVIIGHSMGGAVCLYLATQAGAPSLKKMVLLAPVTSPPKPSAGGTSTAPSAGMDLPTALVTHALEEAYAVRTRITASQIAGYAKGLSSSSQQEAFFMHTSKLGEVSFSASKLAGIKIKTLIIWGEDDKVLCIKRGKELERALPDAKLEQIKSCGHIPHEEQPKETNDLIANFLK
jgi:pimeloyl-ACP methyl ester carboxylesterase